MKGDTIGSNLPAAPEPASASPAPKKKRSVGKVLLIGALVVGGLVAVGSALGGGDDNPATNDDSGIGQGLGSEDASADVEFKGGCDVEFGIATCPLVITNHSDGTSDYFIEGVAYDASGANIGSGIASAMNVEAGGTAFTDLSVILEGDTKFDSVQITEIQRTAS